MSTQSAPPLDLVALSALLSLAEQGSLQAAARACGLPRTTMRRRLLALEDALGVLLLRRDTRELRLTRAGEALAASAGPLLERAEDAVRAAREASSAPTGLVRVGLAPGMPESLVAQVTFEILDAQPETVIRLVQLPDEGGLADAELDIAFHFGPPPEVEGWYSKVLRRMPACLLASRAYLDAHGCPEDVEAVARHRLLLWRGPRSAPDRLPLLAGGTAPASPTLISADISLLRRMASMGGGLAFTLDGQIPDDPGIGELVPVLGEVVGREEHFRVSSRLPSTTDPWAAELAQRTFEMLQGLPDR
ncbi:MAG: LysR family transcriptional regulator [Alphaproteobacteria bacterium]|nr:LysR family transcriptional regulator [Alphaproteobacteria bacterium]MCB9796860.1 LysR family transcriptional regulator [Alphaproteobacteria bacterium]